MAIRSLAIRSWAILAIGLAAPIAALAQTAPLPSPASSPWSGGYVGVTVGGAFGSRTVGYVGNDEAIIRRLTAVTSFAGSQPIPRHGLAVSGVTGGLVAGYDWRSGHVVAGLVADLNITSLAGRGSGTSVLLSPSYTHTASAQQRIGWWTTLRGRLGIVASERALLYATAGVALAEVRNSSSYRFDGPGGTVSGGLPGGSYNCTAPGIPCFTGSQSGVKFGFAAGLGAEIALDAQWSVSVEYLYVRLANSTATAAAVTVVTPGDPPSTYRASFGPTDFHTGRIGLIRRF
jgi:outer membrane immunogenic protein